jgi:hypothetical protein
MKKIKITIMAVVIILAVWLLFIGCVDESETTPETAQGKLLILQAYGNAGDNSPAGVSHSFVELYNISDKAINLSGISLCYADGIRGENVTKDEPWKMITLTGTIPAKGSFLILGAKHLDLSGTRYKINDGYGDINNNNLTLNRRGFKVALIDGSSTLTVQNPFTAGSNGKPISGYIDMVGALNNPNATPPDHIFGFETAPARNSASAAVRRVDLVDYDNNSTDFEEINYSSTGITDEVLKVRKPRNSKAGSWNPFAAPEEPSLPPSPAGNTLLIFQAYGGNNADAVTHNFVELYNNGDAAVNLNGYSLQYAAASSDADTPESDWTVITLTGSIPAKTSYLILGQKNPVQTQRIQIADNSGDVNKSDFVLSNRGFKVALINGTSKLTAVNPYNTDGNWTKAAGYIDMVGCSNTFGTNIITGYEGPIPLRELPRNSAQEGIRRKNLTDTDNNVNDFVSVRYTTERTSQYPHGVDNYEIAFYTPKNTAAGVWSPMDTPSAPPPPTGSVKLMILQIGAATDGNISHSFIELYNNTNAPINLSGYSLQYAAGYSTNSGNGAPGGNTTTDGEWNKINLSGTIQPHRSFLILGSKGTNAAPALSITNNYGDMNEIFTINNRCFKVALMSNTILLTMQNPFNTDGSGTKAAGYVDMVGALNTTGTDFIQGCETNPITDLNKQTGQRRKNLKDTDNNKEDFTRAVFDGATDEEKEIRRPKNGAYGAWDPLTGSKQ